MVTVAMLHYRKHPQSVKKAYTCAAVAKMEGVEFFYFSPSSVNFEEKTIHGYRYIRGDWVQSKMEFPDVIYNVTGMKTSDQKKVYRRLKNMIPFTSSPIGNKIKVYRKVLQLPEFSNYAIPSKKVDNPKVVFQLLEKFAKVIVKPLKGSQGRGVIYIERHEAKFELIEGVSRQLLDKAELQSILLSLIRQDVLLIQPYISSKTEQGLPFDLRLHVQKNGEGKWRITLIYPRIGSEDGIISNVSSGGYIAKLDRFLEREYGPEGYDLGRILEKFAVRFSEEFDGLYKNKLDELGIDIGIDENKKIWIYEVNWRPGSAYRGLDAAMNTIPYAAYLARKHKKDNDKDVGLL